MRQYNAEIFDIDLNFKCNTLLDEFHYKKDYLDPENYSIKVMQSVNVALTDWVNVKYHGKDFIGIVSNIKQNTDGTQTVTLKDFETMVDVDTIWQISKMSTGAALERIVAYPFLALYYPAVESAIKIQSLPLTYSYTQEVFDYFIDWGNLAEGTDYTEKLNPIDKVIVPALKEHNVVFKITPNFNDKTLHLHVYHKTDEAITIEADLVNVLDKEIVINKSDDQLTKLVVIDTDNYLTWRVYYLHPDGTWDRTNSNRVYPTLLKYETACATSETTDGVETTIPFETNADTKADGMFSKNKYENYIKLEVMAEDTLINPLDLEVGQVVNVISGGMQYNSILTGFEYKDDTVELVFGYMRLELTKKLKGRA